MLSKFTLRRMDLLQDPFQQKNLFSAKNGVCTLCAPKNLGDTLDILSTQKLMATLKMDTTTIPNIIILNQFPTTVASWGMTYGV